MSRFAPVHLERPLDGRVSQTMLRHYARCPRSAFLYEDTKGGTQTAAMVRGSAFHTVAQRVIEHAIEHDEPVVPPEVVKDIVAEVLAETFVPWDEHDFLREMSWRFAESLAIDPKAVVACETLFVLDVGGYQVRCKIDFAELRDDGRSLLIDDWKTGLGLPSWDDISRKRSDGSLAPKTLQLILYALALVYGRPVRVEECDFCGGDGLSGEWREGREDDEQSPEFVTDGGSCPRCRHGQVEHVEPLPLAPHVSEVIAEFVFPAVKDSDGRMLRRTMGLTALELSEYRESLTALIANVERSERTGDWPAVVSDAACGECPCSPRCPIPAELRDHRGEINSMEELVEAAEVYYRRSQQLKADRREIKASAKAYGGPSARVRFGRDRVWELGDVRESTTIDDRDALFEAVERAVQFGEPFDRVQFVKTTKSTPFSERALSEEELEAEAAEREAV